MVHILLIFKFVLFLAVLCLRCYVRPFSCCSRLGQLSAACRLLIVRASPGVELELYFCK